MTAPRAVVVATVVETCSCCGSEAEHGERFRLVCSTCFEQLVNLTQQPERKLPRLLTIPQAAEALGVKPRTVRAWIRSGVLPAVKVVGGSTPNGARYRIRRGDLARFMATRATTTHDH